MTADHANVLQSRFKTRESAPDARRVSSQPPAPTAARGGLPARFTAGG